ncbi:hypothetical protein F5Y04DRAFT_262399 [Hypomontagnella monticulosa]|nr:hypothetical protein F5Y04DRAFT_262399 [Hypomontagnella monticulosa]
MTDRQVTESSIGLAGRLTHLPYGIAKAEDRGWKSTRNFTQNVPVFKELGPHQIWFPAAGITGIPSLGPSASSAWQARRRQQRWLLKAHPEARLGNECVHDEFLSSQSYLESDENAPRGSSLFTIGEMTDTSNPKGVSSVPLIVTATGEANDVLRLTIPTVEEWQWANDESVSLRLINVTEKDESILFEEGIVGPIRRLKSVVDQKRYGPTRWIIVQRDSGTRVFQPEYCRAPIQSGYYHERRSSHIAPNPLFFLPKDWTGGNPHSDASFNPSVRSKPPQLGLIDEYGFWSVWDITHTKIKSSRQTKFNLSSCGHIEKGVLDRLPSRGAGKAQWHKIFWVGNSDDSQAFDFEDDEETTGVQGSFPQLTRSSTLLVCSPQQVRLLDLTKNSLLPDLPFVGDSGVECILDVHENPQDTQYIFVLTTSKLFMARVFLSSGRDWGEARKQWTIVLAVSHLRDYFDRSLKLAVSPGTRSSNQATSLVSLYSNINAQIDLFCVNALKSDPFRVTYHRETIVPDVSQYATPDTALQTMCLHTAPATVKASESPTPSARSFMQQQVRFYQFITLKADMCLTSTLSVTTFTLPINQINPPDHRIDRPRDPIQERKKVMKHIAARFVVPDNMNTTGTKREQARGTPRTLPQWPITRRPIGVFYEHLRAVFNDKIKEYQEFPVEEGSFGSNPFDFVHLAIEQAIESAAMPATTLFQIIKNFRVPSNMDLTATEWEHEIERLGHINPNVSLLALNQPQNQVTRLSSLQELYSAILAIMTSTNITSDGQAWTHETRGIVCRHMACDIYLSLFGLVHRKVDVTESQQSLAHDLENMVIDSQQVSRAGSSSRAQSELRASSSRTSTMDPPQEDPAMVLLRSYTGTGKFVPTKPTELLDKWELGANPRDYVFDLDRNREVTPGMQKRAKQLARQNRKRRRAETLLQMQNDQEPSLPATQPAQDTHFFSSQVTQPVGGGFSQSQAIMSDSLQTMTQPVAGTFGRRDERPKKKMKKRKGGF